MHTARGIFFTTCLALLASPAGAAPIGAERALDILGSHTSLPVDAVLGEHEGGLLGLSGEVIRRSGVPEQGMELVWLDSLGQRRDLGSDLLTGDLSSRGELAVVTLHGRVMVGPPGQLVPLDLDLHVTQARWNPDGDRLAVTAWPDGVKPWDASRARTLGELARAIDSDIYLVRPGDEPQRLTTGAKQDYNPVWSPDGEQLLFISLRTGYASFFLTRPGSGEVSQLTNAGAEHGAPSTPVALSDHCWWTQGRIVYETLQTPGAPEVWAMEPDSRSVHVDDGSLVGLFDESWGVLRRGHDFYVFEMAGTFEEGGVQP